MTGDTSNVVVGWPKSIGDGLFLFEDEFIVFESPIAAGGRWYRIRHAFIGWSASGAEIVEKVVSLGIHVSGKRFGRCREGDISARVRRGFAVHTVKLGLLRLTFGRL